MGIMLCTSNNGSMSWIWVLLIICFIFCGGSFGCTGGGNGNCGNPCNPCNPCTPVNGGCAPACC